MIQSSNIYNVNALHIAARNVTSNVKPVLRNTVPIELYCDDDCGANWLDNEPGCNATDADAFCRLKDNTIASYAASFDITEASNQPGYACRGIGKKHDGVGIEKSGMGDVWVVDDVKKSHGNGKVVSNIACTTSGKISFGYMESGTFENISFQNYILVNDIRKIGFVSSF